MTRARMIRRAVGCVLAAAVIGVAAWFFGMDAPHAVGLGFVVFALGAVLSLLGDQAEVAWPVPSPQPRPGARRDVVQLGWSLGARGGRVSPEAVRRLRRLAADVLDRHGVTLDDPAAAPVVAGLLGEETAAMLRKGSAAAPRPKEFAASLARLEALAAPDAPDRPHPDHADTAIATTTGPA
ncbi:hypothetical protein [Leifsonia shinshuensis]|uniref:Uncharacterized protein n=1 Tax=Leifsonia shinshuensis TaxID=150026 RepID=A0A7G6Y6L4_9MICO|nr:hypothetical protein [Leifsonia shinshuensis]QNE34129.1 hypothetical protein F1C12_02595 [Leifsonia shinshuensis]